MTPFELPWAPSCSLFGSEKKRGLYFGQRMNWMRCRPLLQTRSRQAVGAEGALGMIFHPKMHCIILNPALQRALPTAPPTGAQP